MLNDFYVMYVLHFSCMIYVMLILFKPVYIALSMYCVCVSVYILLVSAYTMKVFGLTLNIQLLHQYLNHDEFTKVGHAVEMALFFV